MEPDAERGAAMVSRLRKQSDKLAEGRQGTHKVSADKLRAAVRADARYLEARKWTRVTDDVGQRRGISGKQVRRIVADMQW
jgi:hypothetical protein